MRFHNWPKLTYSWAPAKRPFSPLSRHLCSFGCRASGAGADWSRYNPPLLFFPPLLLVGLIFSPPSLLNWLAERLGGRCGTRRWWRGAEMLSARLAFVTAAWARLAGVNEGRAPAAGFCGTMQTSPKAGGVWAGSCPGMGCKHFSAPLNTEKRSLTTTC